VPNVPRVKAPSCVACNQRLRRIEEEALIPLAMSLDAGDPRAAGVPERVRRSMDPLAATDEGDRRARHALRERVRAMVFHPDSARGELPGCGPVLGSTGAALPVSFRTLEQFGEKLTRVVFFAEYGRYIGPAYRVSTHVAQRNDATGLVADTVRRGKRIEVPPGVFLAVRAGEDDSGEGLVVIDLWGKVRLFTSVLRRETEATAAGHGGGEAPVPS
jgi:hypothetical protein